MDEIALVLSIVERDWGQLLFQPLDFEQVAPFGFLLLVKASVSIGGNTEAALRFLPYVFSIASLVLFWRVARRLLRPPAMLAALAMFATSPTLTLYAGVIKQYSGDVTITLFLVWMTLRILDRPLSRAGAMLIGVGGGLAILTSQPAVLVAAGLGLLLLVFGRHAGTPAGRLLVVCAGWSIGAAIAVWHSLATLSTATETYMQEFWSAGFVPAPWLGVGEALWIPSRTGVLLTFFATGLYPPYPSLLEKAIVGTFMFLLPLGLWRILRIDARAGAALAVPYVVALAAAVVRLLPFGARVSLFAGSFLLIGCFAGFEKVREWVSPRLGAFLHPIALSLMALLGIAALVRESPPIPLGGTLPVLREVKARGAPGDRLLVAGGPWAFRLVDYYGDRLGLEPWVRLVGSPADSTDEQVLRTYLRRIDGSRGEPGVWVHLEGTRICEEEVILGYLDAIGRRRDSVQYHLPWGHRISAHLYDLSDAALVAGISADTYPLPPCELHWIDSTPRRTE
jgi:hypothetical protein